MHRGDRSGQDLKSKHRPPFRKGAASFKSLYPKHPHNPTAHRLSLGRCQIQPLRLVETHRPKAPDSSRGERTRHIYAEATSNTRHWASRDTTSSGTRMINDLSHDACSSRPLLRLFPVFAASV